MNTGEIVKVSEQTGHILVLDNNKQIHEFAQSQWQEPFPPQIGYKVTFAQGEWVRYQTQTTSEQETAKQAKQQAENTQNIHNSSSVYQEFDYQQAQQQEQAQNNQNQQNFQQSQTQQQNFQQHNQAPKRKVQSDELTVIDYDKGIWATYFYCWGNSFNYDGRARRKEFWFFQIANLLALFLFFIAFVIFGIFSAVATNMTESEAESFGSTLGIILYLVNILPALSVSVRRCHDINLSGWLAPLCCIPYIGAIFAIIIGLIDSKPEENDWGLSPKYEI